MHQQIFNLNKWIIQFENDQLSIMYKSTDNIACVPKYRYIIFQCNVLSKKIVLMKLLKKDKYISGT